jgi:methyl-accepting chemotaxis protein
MTINTVLIIIGGVFAIGFIILMCVLFLVSRRSQRVMESLLTLMTRPERARVADATRVLNTILVDEISKIENNFKTMHENLQVQIDAAHTLRDQLVDQNEKMVALADDATKKIATMSGRLDNTVNGLQSIVSSNSWTDVGDAGDRFSGRVNDLLSKIDTTTADITERTATVQSQIENWIERGRELSEQLRGDSETNITQMQNMSAESENMQQKLTHLSAAVTDGFNNVKTAAADYAGVMSHNDKLMGSQIQKIDTFTKQSKTLLNNQMNTLTNTANVVGGQVRLAESSIEKQIKKLVDAVESLIMSATTTEGSVRNVTGELAALTNRFNGEIHDFTTGVVGELQKVSGVANSTLENTRSAAGAFSESVRAMATGVRETLIEMNTAHTQLSGQSENLIKMSSDTTAQLQPLSELIEKYYAALPDLSRGSVELAENLEKIVSAMNDKIALLKSTVSESTASMTESSQKLETLSGQSRQQMIDLMADYAKAVSTMQTLNKQMMVARATAPMDAIKSAPAPVFGKISSDDFIKQSGRVLDKLHEQTVDLTRSTGAEIPDAVWKKYHAGDKTIFTKWLAKMLGAADKRRVRDLLKSDAVFRSQATQFVHSFGKLLNGAEHSDNAEKLMQTLIKTDLGTIYTALHNHI